MDKTATKSREDKIIEATATVIRGGRGIGEATEFLNDPEIRAWRDGWNTGYERGLAEGKRRERRNARRRGVA